MPTIDELHERDKRLEARIEDLYEWRRTAQSHIERLDECMDELRSMLATREDIRDLRSYLRDRDEHHRARIEALEEEHADRATKRDSSFNRAMAWAMAVMFAGEIVLGWLGLRQHG